MSISAVAADVEKNVIGEGTDIVIKVIANRRFGQCINLTSADIRAGRGTMLPRRALFKDSDLKIMAGSSFHPILELYRHYQASPLLT